MRHSHVLGVLLLWSFGLACGDGASNVVPNEVQAAARTFVDTGRRTPANAEYGGASDRTLETRLWLTEAPLADRPACVNGRCALVLLAHGFGGNTARLDGIARVLAQAGYVVAAPRFPLTNEAAPGGHTSGLGDTIEQPADLSFVIDQLLAASSDLDDGLLGGRIDATRIAVLGHSLGGATAIAHSRTACCSDPRVGAVVLVAPVTVLVEGLFHESVRASGPPTLVVSGSLDPVVQPEGPAAFYDAVAPSKVHVLLEGADHVDLIENTGAPAPALLVTAGLVSAFFDQSLGSGGGLVTVLDELDSQGHLVRYELR